MTPASTNEAASPIPPTNDDPEPTVSVALCTYNGARYLPDQLDSLAAQTYRPLELVVCDDCSTDDSAAVIRAFAATAPFPVILHVHPTNVGFIRNFESAIARCSGALIALSDQDDRWHPEKLERSVRAMTSAPDVGGVFTDALIVDGELRPTGGRLWTLVGFGEDRRRALQDGHGFELMLRSQIVTGATLMFRSRFRDWLLPIPPGFAHDAWISLLLAAVTRIVALPWDSMEYRQHGSNVIGVRKKTLRSRLRDARRQRQAGALLIPTVWWEAVEVRLRDWPGPMLVHDPTRLLRARIAHTRARAALPAVRWRRVPLILRELLCGRYHLLSSGWLSVATDLLL